MALADSVEADIQGGPAGRPLLAVPHILADDASLLLHADLYANSCLEDPAKSCFGNWYLLTCVAPHRAACAYIITLCSAPAADAFWCGLLHRAARTTMRM